MTTKKTTSVFPPAAFEGGEEAVTAINEALQDVAKRSNGIIQSEPIVTTFGTEPPYLKDWDKTKLKLASPFHPDDLYFLPQGKGKLRVAAVYATPRVYTQRMNEVIGIGYWQSQVVEVHSAPYTKIIPAKTNYETKEVMEPARDLLATTAGVIVRVGLYMGPVLGWVWQDSSGNEDTGDPNWVMNAEAQAYKRAITKFGPGNYFYDFPKTQYAYDGKNAKWLEQPRIPDWAFPHNFCADCDTQITAVEYKDKEGITQTMSSWDVYQRGINHYGVGVCPECSKKRRSAASNAQADSRLKAA